MPKFFKLLGDRIRDILVLKSKKKAILYLENNVEIGVLEKLN